MQLLWRDVAIGDGPPINTSLTERETAELQRLAKDGDVLEVGTAYGYSTVALALVAKRVTAVDPHLTHGSYELARANLRAYGVSDRVAILQTYSQHALPALFYEGSRFDLVWIDGDHTTDGVTHDVRWAKALLKPGGVIACHDYGEVTCPGVRTALDNIFGGPGDLTDTLAVYTNLPELGTFRQIRSGETAWTLKVEPDLVVEVDAENRVLGVGKTAGKVNINDLGNVLEAVTLVRPAEA